MKEHKKSSTDVYNEFEQSFRSSKQKMNSDRLQLKYQSKNNFLKSDKLYKIEFNQFSLSPRTNVSNSNRESIDSSVHLYKNEEIDIAKNTSARRIPSITTIKWNKENDPVKFLSDTNCSINIGLNKKISRYDENIDVDLPKISIIEKNELNPDNKKIEYENYFVSDDNIEKNLREYFPNSKPSFYKHPLSQKIEDKEKDKAYDIKEDLSIVEGPKFINHFAGKRVDSFSLNNDKNYFAKIENNEIYESGLFEVEDRNVKKPIVNGGHSTDYSRANYYLDFKNKKLIQNNENVDDLIDDISFHANFLIKGLVFQVLVTLFFSTAIFISDKTNKIGIIDLEKIILLISLAHILLYSIGISALHYKDKKNLSSFVNLINFALIIELILLSCSLIEDIITKYVLIFYFYLIATNWHIRILSERIIKKIEKSNFLKQDLL